MKVFVITHRFLILIVLVALRTVNGAIPFEAFVEIDCVGPECETAVLNVQSDVVRCHKMIRKNVEDPQNDCSYFIQHKPIDSVSLTDCDGIIEGSFVHQGKKFIIYYDEEINRYVTRESIPQNLNFCGTKTQIVTTFDPNLPKVLGRGWIGKAKFVELVIINDKYLFVDRFHSDVAEMVRFNQKLVNDAQAHWAKVGVTLILNRTINWSETPQMVESKLTELIRTKNTTIENLDRMIHIHYLYAQSEFKNQDYDAVVFMSGMMPPTTRSDVTLGVAAFNGTCKTVNTLSMLVGDGTNEEFSSDLGDIFAHELGHSIGLPHNGHDFCQCNSTCLMVPAIKSPLTHWTPCTLSQLQVALDMKACLNAPRPTWVDEIATTSATELIDQSTDSSSKSVAVSLMALLLPFIFLVLSE